MLCNLRFFIVVGAATSLFIHAEVPRQWIEPSGHRVVRLTPDSGGGKLYFHQRQFTDDGKHCIVSDGRGIRVVRIDKLPEVSSEVLTHDGAGAATLGAKSHEVFYHSDGKLLATNLDSKQTRTIAAMPATMGRLGDLAINADETLIGGSYVEPKGRWRG